MRALALQEKKIGADSKRRPKVGAHYKPILVVSAKCLLSERGTLTFEHKESLKGNYFSVLVPFLTIKDECPLPSALPGEGLF